ncbi:hypothetical protein EV193_106118 [Herbihabitans rhizosphaerae]|uniref:Integral membrane protein n=1 Tax=Herbihabitans rhizosphaerae TaxID=1872711 RepID=A0A4Q7KKZ7_9PSEU|nr:hypothetical protein [Herbihabitans rhizosphaerae]RZS36884.1 hypothetical protein EV193_106118 [Herbihabitans rhizosphaerae]
MGFVRDLLVFIHLIGMGLLVGMILLQLMAGREAPINKGWLHGSALQLLSGILLMVLAPATDADYNHMKLGIKLVVLVVIGGLAISFMRKESAPKWVAPTLAGLVVLNVGLAVFWN